MRRGDKNLLVPLARAYQRENLERDFLRCFPKLQKYMELKDEGLLIMKRPENYGETLDINEMTTGWIPASDYKIEDKESCIKDLTFRYMEFLEAKFLDSIGTKKLGKTWFRAMECMLKNEWATPEELKAAKDNGQRQLKMYYWKLLRLIVRVNKPLIKEGGEKNEVST